jgi:hypothetical protein
MRNEMKEIFEFTQKLHVFTSEEKIKCFGLGEWVDEPDFVKFNYKNYECIIARSSCSYGSILSDKNLTFGGHLCGYVRLPEGHQYLDKELNDINIDCHGGLTFSKKSIIGFHCAHLDDLMPIEDNMSRLWPIPEEFINCLTLKKEYKNIDFCISECMKIVEQLILLD